MSSKTILIGFNEINFDFIKYYISKGKLNNIKKILNDYPLIETKSENKYELLEPWIQWLTLYTGLTYKEHKIFRLGDITDRKDITQIFEYLESKGKKVGAISPMNIDNRLKNPSFFIPDPWTKTKPNGNWIIQNLYRAIHQSVNNNSKEKLNFNNLINILMGIVFYVPFNRYPHYINLFLNRNKPGNKAIILDSLLSDIFISLWKNKKPDFSHLFLNSGAHIQHHYLFNSKAYSGKLKNPDWYCDKNYDPLEKILTEYDNFIGRLTMLNQKIIIATGLHQDPHKHVTYYWRLRNHKSFIDMLNIKGYNEILPRMSRDFLINFNDDKSSKEASKILVSLQMKKDKKKIFNVDNRGKSLFVELTYPNEINKNDIIESKNKSITIKSFKRFVSFVAIKNGQHNGIGYLIGNFDLNLKNSIQLKEVFKLIKEVV